jgi:hypothetical protein
MTFRNGKSVRYVIPLVDLLCYAAKEHALVEPELPVGERFDEIERALRG